MKATAGPARKPRKAKTATSASKLRASAAKAKAPAKTGAKAKPAQARAGKSGASGQSAPHSGDSGAWRLETLARMRVLVLEADPEIIEEQKWRKPSNGMLGVPVWSRDGLICTGEKYKQVVKLTFAKGASLPDPARLFNSSLEGGTRRAIDIREGEQVDARAFRALIRAAVALNTSAKKR